MFFKGKHEAARMELRFINKTGNRHFDKPSYSKLQLFLFTSCVSIALYAFVRGKGCVCVEHRPSVGVDGCRKHCN